MAKPDTAQIAVLLEPARSIALLFPENPTHDVVASGLALKLVLEKAGKVVHAACVHPMTVEFNRLVGVESIVTSFGGRNLVITFPGQTEHVDKISYNIEAGELQLVVTPKPASPGLDHRKLKFVTGPSQVDLSILVGVYHTSELGSLYEETKDLMSKSKIIGLTLSEPHEKYAHHHVIDTQSASLSELVFQIIETARLKLDPDSASNLFSGLKDATDNFQTSKVSIITFETAANLLRQGAQKHDVLSASDFPEGSIPAAAPQSTDLGFGTDSQPKAPSPDWYEPKIYQGSQLV